ncbi:Uma2 family endonuclease [Thermus thalpophilus]|uniref:Uma2 family endonuclease n=1 Tax=Thermus thalpophilus TaxID=2908147 RepID=UPI001FAB2FA9|nr:Uma2 family endonuclease [Thermus thalpophilus]
MGEATQKLVLLSAEAYLAWEEGQPVRHELLEGIPYAMAGAIRTHNLLVGNLYALLRPRARERGCRIYTETVKLRVGERTFYYPDLMVVCQGEPPHSHYEENPCLVVEVLSEATEVIDRREKLWRYREIRTLQGYLMVESRARRVEAYVREGADWLYRVVEEGEVEVPCLDLRIPLEAVYEGVEV